jgi:hypothetical protein
LSISEGTLWNWVRDARRKRARLVEAARAQVIFALAPFIGAVLAWQMYLIRFLALLCAARQIVVSTNQEATAMSELNPQPIPPGEVRVTVHVPTAILADLHAFQKVQASIFDRFGCGNCNSGVIIDFKHLQEFYVTPELDVRPVLPAGLLEIR